MISKYRWIRIAALSAAFLIMAAVYLAGPAKRTTALLSINGKEAVGGDGNSENGVGNPMNGDGSPNGDSGTGASAGYNQTNVTSQESGAEKSSETDENRIAVYVCGKVAKPGVVRLDAGSRVCDAIEAAGGFTEEAAADYLNLAMVLTDGVQIRVPGQNEVETALSVGNGNAGAAPAMVNLNTATAEELQTLPGIGKSRAGDIISYREKHPFRTGEEIMKVPGIKKGAYEKLKDRITV